MKAREIQVAGETVYVRPLTYREDRELKQIDQAEKTDWLLQHILVDKRATT